MPDDMGEDEIQQLAASVRDEVDGSEYNDDTDYWEEGPSYGERTEDNDPPIFSFVSGRLTRE